MNSSLSGKINQKEWSQACENRRELISITYIEENKPIGHDMGVSQQSPRYESELSAL